LAGAGEVWLGGGGDWALLSGAEGAQLTIGAEQRVHGRGEIQMSVDNLGTLEADTNGRELRLVNWLNNEGVARVFAGGKLSVGGSVWNSGILEPLGGTLRIGASLNALAGGVIVGQPSGSLIVTHHLRGDMFQYGQIATAARIVFDGRGLTHPDLTEQAFFVEAEDFNYGNGNHRAEADVMPYYGGVYAGRGGVDGVDYHQTANSVASDLYRSGEGPSVNVNIARLAQVDRGLYAALINHTVGWNDPSEWYNYTRSFPDPSPGYHVFARCSSGTGPNVVQFDEVVGGTSSANQTLSLLGTAAGPASGQWSVYRFVPLRDQTGELVTLNWTGVRTFRVSILPNGNENIDYIVFAPAESSGRAQFLEVMGQDRGADTAGFGNNFALSTVELAENGYVRLIDETDNAEGSDPEALYLASLVLPAGATLDVNGLNIYARAAQLAGNVEGGSVQVLPDSGPILLATPTPGTIEDAGQVDEWTFFGRSGQGITAVANPGQGQPSPPLAPWLNDAQVELLDSAGGILASQSSASSGDLITLPAVVLTADGTYRVRVSASEGHEAAIGNYSITLWDSTAEANSLRFGEQFAGRVRSPYAVDQWTFSAEAGQQIRLRLINASGPGVVFDLTGPDGWTGFSELGSSSELITFPAAGNYTLIARGSSGQYGGLYAAKLEETVQIDLLPGIAYLGTYAGSGHARLFRVTLPESSPLLVTLNDSSAVNRRAIYARLGIPPTPREHDYQSDPSESAQQHLLAPMAPAGVWYVLLYADYVPEPGNYTLLASTSPILITSVTPEMHGNSGEAVLTLFGAGFDTTSTAELVAGDGTRYAALTSETDSFTRLTARFSAGDVPPGVYAAKVNRMDGHTAELSSAFEMVAGGEADLRTRVVFPAQVGYHQLATIYIEYTNSGSITLPAPLLALTPSQNGREAALLTLDQSRVSHGFWTSAYPEGFTNSVQVLASGKVPGSLQPGEYGRIPVYWAGWQQPWDFSYPPIDFELVTITTDNDEPVDWPSLQGALRPDWASEAVWEVIFGNLTNQVGSTWGDYVSMLCESADYLGKLGQHVVDIESLWDFEVQQARGLAFLGTLTRSMDLVVAGPGMVLGFDRTYGESIERRYARGPFGWGWSTAWSTRLRLQPDGAVELVHPDGAISRFEPDSRTGQFSSPTGSARRLVRTGGGGYAVVDIDGFTMRFSASGRLTGIEDTNGNRITAAYDSDRLARLTHSAGGMLSIAYNQAGLIESIVDSMNRTNTYTYDASLEYLIESWDYQGTSTRYTYITNGLPGALHALESITYPDGTHDYYAYDEAGRLAATFGDDNAERLDISYGDVGTLTMTTATGERTQLFYDHELSVARTEFACCYRQYYTFDALHRVSQVTDAEGRTQAFQYDDDGLLIQDIDSLGNLTRYTHSGDFGRMTSVTDPLGHTLRYEFDAQGNPTAIVAPDGSRKTLTYDALGNLTAVRNRRLERTEFNYDTDGRLTRITGSDGEETLLSYGLIGSLLSISNMQGTITLEYDDPTDQIAKVSYPDGRFLAYAYDAVGRRIRMTDHLGESVHYDYDAVGRLATLSNSAGGLVVRYTSDAAGRVSRKDHGNGTYSSFDYDDAGRIMRVAHHAPDDSLNSQFEYFYDSAGHLVSTSTLDGDWTFEHDVGNQLTRARFVSRNPAIPNQDLTYVHDAVGNRIRTVDNGATVDYTSNKRNQYLLVGNSGFTYDPEGNLTKEDRAGATTEYSYDRLDRLIGVSRSGDTWEYEYDGFGNRSATVHNGVRTEYLVDPVGLGAIVAEFGAGGDLIARNAFGLGLVGRVGADGEPHYYDFDVLGSTAGISGRDGNYLNRYAYRPFGEKLMSDESVANPYEFIGELGVMDEGHGLAYVRARYYNYTLGRFISEDPTGIDGGDLNLYRYSGNSPLMSRDASGQRPCKDVYVGCIRAPYGDIFKGIPTKLIGFPKGCSLDETLAQDSCLFKHEDQHIENCRMNGPGSLYDFKECNAEELRGLKIQRKCYRDKHGAGATTKELEKWIKEARDGSKGKGPGYGNCKKLRKPAKPPRPKCPKKSGAKRSALRPMGDDPWPPPDGGPGSGSGGDDGPSGGFPPGPPPGSGGSCSGGSGGAAGAVDPNQKIGPAGFGGFNHVLAGAQLPYRIDFENESEAKAPAQYVLVTDQLDDRLDWTRFAITEVGFGGQLIVLPQPTAHFETVVTTTQNDREFEVHIRAGIDMARGTVTARFSSIDPGTGLPPDVLTGFLSPEDGTGRGQGHISYVVSPKAGLASGTELRNVSRIQFDFGETIATNQRDPHDPLQGTDPSKEALVTLDGTPPQSHVLTLPATVRPGAFEVRWSGTDGAGGVGLATYDVYVSINFGAWTLWQQETTSTAEMFPGELGQSYAFFSVARDHLGHIEAPPETADTATTVTVAAPPSVDISVTDETQIVVSWSVESGAYRLMSTSLVEFPLQWELFPGTPTVIDGRNVIVIQPTNSTQFYRLEQE